MQRIHILGICGTFMGGVALLAKQLGFAVSGSDQHIYPPISSMLDQAGIKIYSGYDISPLQGNVDQVIIGNALSRGNPAVEYVLDHQLPYTSGPAWLAQQLRSQHVIAVAGTHGKTTTTSLLTWILQESGYEPGYLIGGVANQLPASAQLGGGRYFVIEADEYDSAFFDKRSKFIHYHPQTLIINNIEYDHADIFADLAAIQKQFSLLLRTVPSTGHIVCRGDDNHIQTVLDAGCWTPVSTVASQHADWQATVLNDTASRFSVSYQGESLMTIDWQLFGRYNIENALSAIAAAVQLGVDYDSIVAACASFKGVKRRMQVRGCVNDITVYDDFAHHPTAIAHAVDALRHKTQDGRVIAVIELAANSMKMGSHPLSKMVQALTAADQVIVLRPQQCQWNVDDLQHQLPNSLTIKDSVGEIISQLANLARPHDQILIMSNKGFEKIHQRLLETLSAHQ